MLEAVLADGEGRSLGALAEELGVPKATAHRQIATLVHENYLRRLPSGRLVAGKRLQVLARQADDKQVILAAAAPVLHRLAARLDCVAHLGTFENDMVTYRIKTGDGAASLFTQVGMQLEAYCSGIGKVLVAHLPEIQRQAYLAGGPFVALTSRTITNSVELEIELERVREQGYAIDNGEIADGLVCVAVPIRAFDGQVHAAISASGASSRQTPRATGEILRELCVTAREIEQAAFETRD